MRYLRLIRNEGENFITIGEYIACKRPLIAKTLDDYIKSERTAKVLDMPFEAWDKIMREPPKPGLGGLLDGESAGDI